MDRLTGKAIVGWEPKFADTIFGSAKNAMQCHNRLVEYEDTGLTPEEITRIKEELEQAEAALGEAVGIMKDFTDPSYHLIPQTEVELNYSRKTRAKAQQFLQSPAAKAASERWSVMKAQNEIMRGALEAIAVLDKDSITGDARAYYMQRIARDALDACERVKGE